MIGARCQFFLGHAQLLSEGLSVRFGGLHALGEVGILLLVGGQILRDLLGSADFKMIEAWDGEAGLTAAASESPDLILMDIQLPGVSGLVVAKWIREDDALKATPIIAVTAMAMKGDEDRIREGGCDTYMAKPISAPMFLKTVDKYLS